MAVYTDSPGFAAGLLDLAEHGWEDPDAGSGAAAPPYVRAFLPSPWRLDGPFTAAFPDVVVAETADGSNYDRLIQRVREGGAIPDRLVCLAGSGHGFHGFKGRPWAAVPGNVHLSVHLAPRRPVERFEVAFMALAAVSVVEAIDGVRGLDGRAGIRWVNDIVLDQAKVAGVLAYTHAQRTTVNAAVLGIGVNVLTRPAVEPTPFVPAVTALAEHASPDARASGPASAGGPGASVDAPAPPLLPAFLARLLAALDGNYRTLLRRGHGPIVERYRARSVVVGRRVEVCAEDSDAERRVLARGIVRAVGPGLELYLEGRESPVTRGRIVVLDGNGPGPG